MAITVTKINAEYDYNVRFHAEIEYKPCYEECIINFTIPALLMNEMYTAMDDCANIKILPHTYEQYAEPYYIDVYMIFDRNTSRIGNVTVQRAARWLKWLFNRLEQAWFRYGLESTKLMLGDGRPWYFDGWLRYTTPTMTTTVDHPSFEDVNETEEE